MKNLCTYFSVIFLGSLAFAEQSPNDSSPVRLSLDDSFTADLRLAQTAEVPTDEKVQPDIHYVPTPQELVEIMLRMASVKKDDILYDLGSGDGRLVITAAKKYGARGIGIDIDPERIREAKENAAVAGVESKVEFRQADLFRSDFRDATVITLYLLEELNQRLRPHIFAQVKPGTRLVSHAFRMGDWEPDAEKSITLKELTYNAYYWVVPANMSGRWKITEGEKAGALPDDVFIEQTFQKITARAGEGGDVLGEGKVIANEFTLKLTKAGNPKTFTGRIDGQSITAISAGKGGNWKAEREAGSEKPLDPPRAENASPSPES